MTANISVPMNVELNLERMKKAVTLTIIEDLTPEHQKLFKDMIDEIILFGEEDRELMEGFRMMGVESHRRAITVYDLILEAYTKHEIEQTVKKWNEDRKK